MIKTVSIHFPRVASHKMDQNSGINRARARAHHQTFERGEAHRGVDALAALDGGKRAAVAEMASDDLERSEISLEHLRRPMCAVLVIDAVKSVAADAASFIPLVRERIYLCFERKGAMKAGVENCGLRNIRQHL